MKYVYLLLLFFVLTYSAKAQQLQIDSNELFIDYGNILLGTPTKRILTVRNIGEAPLVLMTLKGNCGCLDYGIIDPVIMPNQTGKIYLEYRWQSMGVFTKYFTLSTNSKGEPMTRIKIKGQVTARPYFFWNVLS